MSDHSRSLGQRVTLQIQRARPHLSRTGWATLEALIGPILSIVVSPVLLFTLESHGFGIWALALAVTGFGGMASLGIGVATTKIVSEDRAAGRHREAVTTTRAALSIALLGALLLLIFGGLFAPGIATIAFARMGGTEEVSRALLLGLALLALQEIESVFTGALRGAQRFDLGAGLELGSRVAWVAVVSGTAWLTRDVISTLIASVVVTIAKVCIKGWAANRVLKGPCFLPSCSRIAVERLLHLGKWLWVQGLGGLLFSVVDKLVVGAIFGAADLGRYSICMQLAQLVHGVQANALQPMLPWIASRTVSRQPTAGAALKKLAVVGGFACLVVPVLLIFLAEPLLRLWIGPGFARENANICRLLIGGYGLLAFSIPAHYMLLGLGNVRFLAATNIAAGLVSLCASLALSPLGFAYFAAGKLFFAPLIFLNFLVLHRSAERGAAVTIESIDGRNQRPPL